MVVLRNRRETTREQRRFKAHDQLLVSVIKRQAGSLWKAVVEGVMNAVDAGATKCEISLTPQMLTIKDNGRGFRSKKEIEDFFETFGQPHEDAEDKVFGQFRMGRGQLFAYGRNTWRTGKFEMSVDINVDGLNYHLEEGLAQEDGCTIAVELYEPLSHTAHAEMVDQLEQNCKYVSLVCTVNDRQINKLPTSQTWDMETAEASIRFRNTGNLVIYNQGVKVCEWQRYRLGVGGEVVTKQNLQVNFARNDVMSNCPVWAKIQAAILGHSNASAAGNSPTAPATQRQRRPRTPALTEADRKRLVNQIKDKQVNAVQTNSLKVIQEFASTKNISLAQLWRRCGGKLTLPPAGLWRTSEDVRTLTKSKMAFPVNRANLSRWGVDTIEAFVNVLNNIQYGWYKFKLVPWDSVVEYINQRKAVVDEKDLNRVEVVVLAVLRKNLSLIRPYRPGVTWRIDIGEARDAQCWSNGKGLIVLNRTFVQRTGCGPTAWLTYGLVLLHELGHTQSTAKRHAHSQAFYKNFHDNLILRMPYTISNFVSRCMTDCPTVAERLGRRLTRTELRAIDAREAQARRAAAVVGTAAVAPAEASTEEPDV